MKQIVLRSSVFYGKKVFGLIRPLILLPVQELFWHCKLQSVVVFFYIFIFSYLTFFLTAASVFGLCAFNLGWQYVISEEASFFLKPRSLT